jgi:hypothetical protein
MNRFLLLVQIFNKDGGMLFALRRNVPCLGSRHLFWSVLLSVYIYI